MKQGRIPVNQKNITIKNHSTHKKPKKITIKPNQGLYVKMGNKTYYFDNSTNEEILNVWNN
tara:strand:+ start:84 stop:266 length:183 start_codon:yes stop_codon:yes gene_type:complete